MEDSSEDPRIDAYRAEQEDPETTTYTGDYNYPQDWRE